MPKIKHIALTTADPDATARFYIDVFGMKEVGKIDNPTVAEQPSKYAVKVKVKGED